MFTYLTTDYSQISFGKITEKESSQISLENLELSLTDQGLEEVIQLALRGETLIMTETLISSPETLPIKIVEVISLSRFGYVTPAKRENSNSKTRDRVVFFIRNHTQVPQQRIMTMTETSISSSLPYTESHLLVVKIIQSSFVTKDNSSSQMQMQQLNLKA